MIDTYQIAPRAAVTDEIDAGHGRRTTRSVHRPSVINKRETELHPASGYRSGFHSNERPGTMPLVVTDVLRLDPIHPDPEGIAQAAAILKRGGLVAFPTETVYGLGANALDRTAIRRVFEAKGRPAHDPLIVHIHDADALGALASEVPSGVEALASAFWPGPMTIVLRRAPGVPDEVTAGLDTVAIRMPSHPIARALLQAAAVPIAAPSANLFSRPSPTTAQHVLEDLDGRVDLVIDGGPTAVGIESTVIDLTVSPPAVLRPGAVSLEMLQRIVPAVQIRGTHAAGSRLKSPGLLDKHYSPHAPLTLYEGPRRAVLARIAGDAEAAIAGGQRVGILVAIDDELSVPSAHVSIERPGPEGDVARLAANLYTALRRFDAAGVDLILARGFPADTGLGVAIRDRLRRAAAGHVVVVQSG